MDTGVDLTLISNDLSCEKIGYVKELKISMIGGSSRSGGSDIKRIKLYSCSNNRQVEIVGASIDKVCGLSPEVSFDPNEIFEFKDLQFADTYPSCLLYTSPSPRDKRQSRMPSSA